MPTVEEELAGLIARTEGRAAPRGGPSAFESRPDVKLGNPDVMDAVRQFGASARKQGYRVVVTSGDRSSEQQARLYANRGSNPNPVARPGTSRHERGLAVDLNVFQGGKRVSPAALAELAKEHGLHWLGDRDPVHFDYRPAVPGNAPQPLASRSGNVVGSRKRIVEQMAGQQMGQQGDPNEALADLIAQVEGRKPAAPVTPVPTVTSGPQTPNNATARDTSRTQQGQAAPAPVARPLAPVKPVQRVAPPKPGQPLTMAQIGVGEPRRANSTIRGLTDPATQKRKAQVWGPDVWDWREGRVQRPRTGMEKFQRLLGGEVTELDDELSQAFRQAQAAGKVPTSPRVKNPHHETELRVVQQLANQFWKEVKGPAQFDGQVFGNPLGTSMRNWKNEAERESQLAARWKDFPGWLKSRNIKLSPYQQSALPSAIEWYRRSTLSTDEARKAAIRDLAANAADLAIGAVTGPGKGKLAVRTLRSAAGGAASGTVTQALKDAGKNLTPQERAERLKQGALMGGVIGGGGYVAGEGLIHGAMGAVGVGRTAAQKTGAVLQQGKRIVYNGRAALSLRGAPTVNAPSRTPVAAGAPRVEPAPSNLGQRTGPRVDPRFRRQAPPQAQAALPTEKQPVPYAGPRYEPGTAVEYNGRPYVVEGMTPEGRAVLRREGRAEPITVPSARLKPQRTMPGQASTPPAAQEGLRTAPPVDANPFRAKAEKARAEYERLAGPTAGDKAMAEAFPLGAGRGGKQRPGAEKRIDASVGRAVKANEAFAKAKALEAQADAFDAGKINAQGRRPSATADANRTKRDALQERYETARIAREGKEAWQVPGGVYADASKNFGGRPRQFVLGEHREKVQQALSEGRPVPPEVLADYPDLQPTPKPQPPKAGASTLVGETSTAAPATQAAKAPLTRSAEIAGETGQGAGPSLPKPKPGTVRFYHGGSDYQGGPRWLTEDRNYADGYARKSSGRVHYVDVPETELERLGINKIYDDTGTDQRSPYVHFDAPESIAKNLRPVDAPIPSKPADLPASENNYVKKSDLPGTEHLTVAQRNGLAAEVVVPKDDPRPASSSNYVGGGSKAVMRYHLGEELPEGTKAVFHETNSKNAASIVARMRRYGHSTQSNLWVSDNLDLALGQRAKGVVLEFDPRFLNGNRNMDKPGLAKAQGGEYNVSKATPPAVQAVIVKNKTQLKALQNDPVMGKLFDWESGTETSRGTRYALKGRKVAETPATQPQAAKAPLTRSTEIAGETGQGAGLGAERITGVQGKAAKIGSASDLVDAFEEAVKSGGTVTVSTRLRVTPLSRSGQLRVHSDGSILIPEGKRWVALGPVEEGQLRRQLGIPITEEWKQQRSKLADEFNARVAAKQQAAKAEKDANQKADAQATVDAYEAVLAKGIDPNTGKPLSAKRIASVRNDIEKIQQAYGLSAVPKEAPAAQPQVTKTAPDAKPAAETPPPVVPPTKTVAAASPDPDPVPSPAKPAPKPQVKPAPAAEPGARPNPALGMTPEEQWDALVNGTITTDEYRAAMKAGIEAWKAPASKPTPTTKPQAAAATPDSPKASATPTGPKVDTSDPKVKAYLDTIAEVQADLTAGKLSRTEADKKVSALLKRARAQGINVGSVNLRGLLDEYREGMIIRDGNSGKMAPGRRADYDELQAAAGEAGALRFQDGSGIDVVEQKYAQGYTEYFEYKQGTVTKAGLRKPDGSFFPLRGGMKKYAKLLTRVLGEKAAPADPKVKAMVESGVDPATAQTIRQSNQSTSTNTGDAEIAKAIGRAFTEKQVNKALHRFATDGVLADLTLAGRKVRASLYYADNGIPHAAYVVDVDGKQMIRTVSLGRKNKAGEYTSFSVLQDRPMLRDPGVLAKTGVEPETPTPATPTPKKRRDPAPPKTAGRAAMAQDVAARKAEPKPTELVTGNGQKVSVVLRDGEFEVPFNDKPKEKRPAKFFQQDGKELALVHLPEDGIQPYYVFDAKTGELVSRGRSEAGAVIYAKMDPPQPFSALKAAPTPSPTPAAAAKAQEPWQMTRQQYEESARLNKIPPEFEALDAISKRNNKGSYNPDVITDASIQNLKAQGWLSGSKNFKLTESGAAKLNDWRKAARDNDLSAGDAFDQHVGHVEKALAQGKPVPPEVLADYPDLAPNSTPAAAAKAEPTARPARKTIVNLEKRGPYPDDLRGKRIQLAAEIRDLEERMSRVSDDWMRAGRASPDSKKQDWLDNEIGWRRRQLRLARREAVAAKNAQTPTQPEAPQPPVTPAKDLKPAEKGATGPVVAFSKESSANGRKWFTATVTRPDGTVGDIITIRQEVRSGNTRFEVVRTGNSYTKADMTRVEAPDIVLGENLTKSEAKQLARRVLAGPEDLAWSNLEKRLQGEGLRTRRMKDENGAVQALYVRSREQGQPDMVVRLSTEPEEGLPFVPEVEPLDVGKEGHPLVKQVQDLADRTDYLAKLPKTKPTTQRQIAFAAGLDPRRLDDVEFDAPVTHSGGTFRVVRSPRDASFLENFRTPLSIVDGAGNTLQKGYLEAIGGEKGKEASQLIRGTQRRMEALRIRWNQGLDDVAEQMQAARRAVPGMGKRKFEEDFIELLELPKDDPKRLGVTGAVKKALELHDKLTEEFRKYIIDARRSLGDDVPDDWGITERGYFRHLFLGDLQVFMNGKFMGTASTYAEAQSKAWDLIRDNPGADVTAQARTSFSGDPTLRVSTARYWKTVAEITDSVNETGESLAALTGGDVVELSKADIMADLRGVVGMQRSKQKFFGALIRRKGAGGYLTEYDKVMRIHASQVARTQELSKLNRSLVPLIEQFKRDGLPGLAEDLEGHLADLWGTPAKWEQDFGRMLQTLPVVRNHVASPAMAFRRTASKLTSIQSILRLRFNLRSSLVNLAQPLTTLWPYAGTVEFAGLYADAVKPSTRKMLEAKGVLDGATKMEGWDGLAAKIPNPFGAASGVNKAIGYLFGYRRGLKAGMSEAASHDNGLAWVEKVEFDNSVWNAPPALRSAQGRLFLQFKGFTIKNLENVSNILRRQEGERWLEALPRRAKYLAAQGTFGGLSSFSMGGSLLGGYLVVQQMSLQFQKLGMKKEDAERTAKGIYYGAPGLVGIDLSGSFAIADPPFGRTWQEQAVSLVGGPTVGTVGGVLTEGARQWKKATKPKDPRNMREDDGEQREGRDLKVNDPAWLAVGKKASPYFTQGDAVRQYFDGKAYFKSAGGKAVRLNRGEALLKALGFTPMKQSTYWDKREAGIPKERGER